MITFLSIVFILLSISIHEMGHAIAMRRCGVQVKEICLLGIPLPKVPPLILPNLFPGFFPGTIWKIHLLPVGAYVEGEKEDLKKLGYGDASYVYGAGVLANLLYALFLSGILGIVSSGEGVFADVIKEAGGLNDAELKIFYALATLVCILLVLIFCRIICSYLFPVLGIASLYLILEIIMTTPIDDSGMAGPIGLVSFVGDLIEALYAKYGVASALVPGALISIGIGMFNLIPLVPLDGGKTMHKAIHSVSKKMAGYYEKSTMFLTLLVILYVITADIVRAFF